MHFSQLKWPQPAVWLLSSTLHQAWTEAGYGEKAPAVGCLVGAKEEEEWCTVTDILFQ